MESAQTIISRILASVVSIMLSRTLETQKRLIICSKDVRIHYFQAEVLNFWNFEKVLQFTIKHNRIY